MALPPEISRPLHNFTLPPLRWANQRHRSCRIDDTQQPNSLNPGSETPSSPPPTRTETHHQSSVADSPVRINDDEGIEAVHEKIFSDLRFAAERMNLSTVKEKEKQQQIMAVPAGANASTNEPNSSSNSDSARPFNMRTRRAAFKKPSPPRMESPRKVNGRIILSNKPPESLVVADKSTRVRGYATAVNTARQSLEGGENSKRVKFSMSLTREDIESDILLMTGTKPPRRPKKRNRNVQKQLNYCIPGLLLSEVTPDAYKVPDLPRGSIKFIFQRRSKEYA